MSIRQDRNKIIEEHKKFLSDNTKDEQKALEAAKTLTTTLDEKNKTLITQINDKNKELTEITNRIVSLKDEIILLNGDLNDIKSKIDLSYKKLKEVENEITDKKEEFDKFCFDKNADLLIRETSLKELSESIDEKARETSLMHDKAKNEQARANETIEVSTKKISELKDLIYDHAKTMAKYDQDRAKLHEEADKVDAYRTTLNKASKALDARELAVLQRENEIKAKDEILNDRERRIVLKEATLNKREQKIEELIEIHHLKDL